MGRLALLRLGLCLAGAMILSEILRQDANWDLRNYHLYTAFAWAGGRLGTDLFAAGIQTYLNPLLDVPYYWLAVRVLPTWPRLVAALAGLPFGALAFLVWMIAREVARTIDAHDRAWFVGLAVLLGLSGTTVWSEIGTTFGDMPIAVLVLAAILVLVRALAGTSQRWIAGCLIAGLLLGIATGLKLTAAVFVPGCLFALLATSGGLRRGWPAAAAFSGFWLLGFLASFGWWGVAVAARFGNPIFPALNTLFRSPWYPPVAVFDTRFLPRDIWQDVLYPFFWLRGRSFVVSELPLADPRFAAAYLSVVLLVAMALPGRRRPLPQPVPFLCVFVSVSFAIWQALFSILRYALPLEALTGLLIMLALLQVAAQLGLTTRQRRVMTACAAAAILAVSNYAGWGRLKAYDARVFTIAAPPVPDGALIILADKPLGFLAPLLPARDARFVGIIDILPGNRLWDEVRRLVQDQQGPIRVLLIGDPGAHDAALRGFGMELDPAGCAEVQNHFQSALMLCPAHKS